MFCFFTKYNFFAQLLLCIQAVIFPLLFSLSHFSHLLLCHLLLLFYPQFLPLFKMIYVFSTAVFYLSSMSLIFSCLYMGPHNLFSTQTVDCQQGKDRTLSLNEVTDVGETKSFKFRFLQWSGRGYSLPPKSPVCMWHYAWNAVCCCSLSAVNVSHHVKMKCAFNV